MFVPIGLVIYQHLNIGNPHKAYRFVCKVGAYVLLGMIGNILVLYGLCFLSSAYRA